MGRNDWEEGRSGGRKKNRGLERKKPRGGGGGQSPRERLTHGGVGRGSQPPWGNNRQTVQLVIVTLTLPTWLERGGPRGPTRGWGWKCMPQGEQSTRSSQCLLICLPARGPGRECCLFSYPCVAFTCVSHTLAFPGLR